jgi:hypothetical protein
MITALLNDMIQARAESGKAAVDDLLTCGYPTVGTIDDNDSDRLSSSGSDRGSRESFVVNREKYPFCHVLSSGQVAVYWTHDVASRGLDGKNGPIRRIRKQNLSIYTTVW